MKITGTIKVLSFKGERVVIKLGDAQFFEEGKWEKQHGDVWISSFDAPVIQSVRQFDEDDDSNNIKKGSEIQANVKKFTARDGREYLNIVNIGLKVKETDVNEDLYETLPEDAPFPKEETPPEEEMPSSKQRPKDSPEAEAEESVKSIAVDTKEYRIVFQACLKGVGASHLAKSIDELIDMAEKATQRTFRGKS